MIRVAFSAIVAALFWPNVSEARGKEVFAVRDADIDWQGCLQLPAKEVALACHRLKSGDNLILAMRHRLGRSWGDRGAFQKLTIVLPPNVKSGESYFIRSDEIKAFFSNGSRVRQSISTKCAPQ